EEIKVGSGEYLLDGIMTIPKNVEKPPVVILVQGSGPSDMDETIGANNNKPFRDIAQGLAEKGIATIRYNKRFQQYGDSVTERVTIADEVLDDVSSAIELAKKSDVLDTSRIFVLGHSLGGMLSPKIATDHPEVAGIIALAGSPRHLEDIIYDQNKYFLDLDETISQEDKESMLETVQTYVDQVKNLSEEDLATPILDVTGYYWKSLNEIDTPTLVKNLKIPMLFLQGSADFQVFADKDFVEWQNILKGHENAQFIQYEGLNHLFMQTTGEKDPSDYDYKNNVDHKVIDDIANWILE
ncbi:MAG: alpha/beta fold hydrolase, partial [Clostridiales bacterium]|nr:alpha/beta fold hydrolase [Clostridiales bacterium]